MTIVVSALLPEQRKRTCSFSYPHQPSPFAPNPRPAKAPRVTPPAPATTITTTTNMGAPLRRTESFITFAPSSATATSSTATRKSDTPLTSHRPPQRRKVHINRSLEPISIRLRQDHSSSSSSTTRQPIPTKSHSTPHSPPPSCIGPPTVYAPPRKSSPLAPTRVTLASRPLFPRSRPEPDLYRKALKTSMKSSPDGQKILRMGPRLAVSIMTATKELERLVAASQQSSLDGGEMCDVVMSDATTSSSTSTSSSPSSPVLSKSWVVVPGEDWEMVDCAA